MRYLSHPKMVEIELIRDICPRCGEKTTFVKYEWDDGLCGGYGFQWNEKCKPCDIDDCKWERKIVKEERTEAKHQKKIEYYNTYLKEFIE